MKAWLLITYNLPMIQPFGSNWKTISYYEIQTAFDNDDDDAN
jgi:hypothetical protein